VILEIGNHDVGRFSTTPSIIIAELIPASSTHSMFSPVCYLREEDIMGTEPPLRIGYVPEHFSTPIYFAQQRFGLSADLIPFPSGTGHMITALRAGEIDIGIGLTEGWVAGLGKEDVVGDGGYQLVGTYVETPLCERILSDPARLTRAA
jgi:hypothetical protein